MSFYFGFYHNLTNRESTEVASGPLSFLCLRGATLGRGEGTFVFRILILVEGYTFKSFFSLLLDPSPPMESVFDVI